MTIRPVFVALFVCVLVVLFAPPARSMTLTLSWDPPLDTTGIGGYVLSFGTTSGVYTRAINVGTSTVFAVDGLVDSSPYYFVVQAYNVVGDLSLPTPEAVYSPSLAISCPVPLATTSGNLAVVTFAPTVINSVAPAITTCTPVSGSQFRIGATAFSCTVTDARPATASCTSTVVVTFGPSITSPGTPGTVGP